MTATVSARRPDPSLPPSMLRTVFDARIGEVVAEPTPGGDTAVVAVVDGVSFEGDPNAEALLGSYQDQVGQQVAGELLNAYIQALEAEYGVTRDDAVIAQALGFAE